jgi:hypothetical protein
MKFCPRLDETCLRAWQISGDELDRIETEDSNLFLVIRVEVWRVVRSTRFDEHANDDAEKSADLGHGTVILRFGRPGPPSRVTFCVTSTEQDPRTAESHGKRSQDRKMRNHRQLKQLSTDCQRQQTAANGFSRIPLSPPNLTC